MPLRRTPPTSAVPEADAHLVTMDTISPSSGSTPNLYTSEYSNITARFKKRKHDGDITPTFMDELRDMISVSTATQDNRYIALHNSITEVISQNNDIRVTLSAITDQYMNIKEKLELMEGERNEDRTYIKQLEEKIEKLERRNCSTKLEVRNIPRQQNETKETLAELIIKAVSVLEVPVQSYDIKDIFRAKSESVEKPIVVEFGSVLIKDKIIRNARRFNREHSDGKLNITHIFSDCPPKPIYVSECLTFETQKLFYYTRKFAKENSYKYCWTSYGKIYLRKEEGIKQIQISSNLDLVKLRENMI